MNADDQVNRALAAEKRVLLPRPRLHQREPCHFIVNGAIDAPGTLGRMLGAERFAQLRTELGETRRLLHPHTWRRATSSTALAQEVGGRMRWARG